MSPIKLLGLLFSINLFAVVLAIDFVRPDAPDGLQLRQVSIQQPSAELPQLISGKPSQLKIDSISVDIPVVDGTYNPQTKEWALSSNNAHYALMTPEANNLVGNTFIYGHNKKEVFSRLENLKGDETAEVTTHNGKKFIYKLKNIREVQPTDVSLFEYQGSSILTVQTCSGSWYEKRKLFTFEFVEVIE